MGSRWLWQLLWLLQLGQHPGGSCGADHVQVGQRLGGQNCLDGPARRGADQDCRGYVRQAWVVPAAQRSEMIRVAMTANWALLEVVLMSMLGSAPPRGLLGSRYRPRCLARGYQVQVWNLLGCQHCCVLLRRRRADQDCRGMQRGNLPVVLTSGGMSLTANIPNGTWFHC